MVSHKGVFVTRLVTSYGTITEISILNILNKSESICNIYPTGSQPAGLNGLPQLLKVEDSRSAIPPFRRIVS